MFPKICSIGPFTIYSYGLTVAIAVVVCAFLCGRDAKKEGISTERIYDFAFWCIVGGLLGARIFYIILNFDFFMANPSEIIMVQNGGLAWQGGLIMGTAAGWWKVSRMRLSHRQMMDLVAPYIALGESIGRIGCFLNGCCYGKAASWGIYFPVHDAKLIPTQLFTSAGLFGIFLILKSFRRKEKYKGQTFVFYLILASILRFLIEFIRADHYVTFLGLSVYQWVCVGLILTAFYVHTRFKGRGIA